MATTISPKNKVYNLEETSSGVFKLEIFDLIDPFWGYGVRELAYDLSQIGPGKKLSVRINSDGGSAFEGFAIAEILRGYNGEVETIGTGIVASIATIILLAGDTVKLTSGSFFMIHEPRTFSGGDRNDLERDKEILDKLYNNLVNVYVDAIEGRGKLQGSREETRSIVENWVSNETWFTSSEALSNGFVDEIISEVPFINKANAQRYLNRLEGYTNTPEALINKLNSQNMADKSIIAKIRNLLQSEETETEETTETTGTDTALEDARALLEEAGYNVTEAEAEAENEEEETEETETETEEETDTGIDEDELSRIVNERVEAALRAREQEVEIKNQGKPSGSSRKPKGKPSRPINRKRQQAFDALAQAVTETAKKG